MFEQLGQSGGAEAAVLDVLSVRSAGGAVQVQDHWVVAGVGVWDGVSVG